MNTAGIQLLLKTAQQSFWSNYYAIPDPFDGLVWTRQSTQAVDTFPRLGAAPMPGEWIGDKQPKVAPEYTMTLANKAFESSVRVGKKLLKYEQWSEVAGLIGNLGQKARDFRVKKMTELIVAGTAATGDDGQFFFDTDHADPGADYSTNQDNDKTAAAATGTQPTDLEAASALRTCIDAFYSYKDDRGDPMVPQNDDAANFIVMVPPVYRSIFRRVLLVDQLAGPVGNDMKGAFTLRVNPFMTAADQFFMFYAGGTHKPIIQNESGGVVGPIDNVGSDQHISSGDVTFSTEQWGTWGYGQWRTALSFIFS